MGKADYANPYLYGGTSVIVGLWVSVAASWATFVARRGS